MKVQLLLYAILISTGIINGQKKQAEISIRIPVSVLINSQWTFNYFPSDTADRVYESPGYNDARWSAISLPHTWNTYETTRELSPFTKSPGETGETYWWTGWGWYRKHFTINADYTGKKVFIEFEGVQKYCKVWVNGKNAGSHKGGYGSFDFDITDLIRPGQDNLLAVAVSNLQKDEFLIHPTSEGKSNVSCGITGNVRLVLKNRLYIPAKGSASHEGGAFITTPVATEGEGVFCATSWVKNDFPEPRTCILQTTLLDRNKSVIQVIRSEAVINPGQLFMFVQNSKSISKPHLWSTKDPYLYTIRMDVFDRKELTDSYYEEIGFKNCRYNVTDSILFLNNSELALKACTLEHGYPWLGDAVPEWITENILNSVVREKEFNLIRTDRYPSSNLLPEIADRAGLLIEEDCSGLADHGFSIDEQRQQVTEMVRRHRNHPSLVSWLISPNPGVALKIFPVYEDSLHIKGPLSSGSFFLPASEISLTAGSGSGSLPVDAVEPARLTLISSHNSIPADRGSIVLLKAFISDTAGRQVMDMNNAIRWTVTGPARLIGPASQVSYADSSRKDEGLYIKMPSTNLIRSTGLPGRIRISVFSAGIASASVEIESTDSLADNSVITEPKLSDVGRRAVSMSQLVTRRLDETPKEIFPLTDDLNPGINSRSWYVSYLKQLVLKGNPRLDTTMVELTAFTDLIASQLLLNRGFVSSSDFNYNADHFNSCRLIAGFISRTKLPLLFKESLRRYYSDIIIRKGIEKNAGDEMDWLNWIPSGGVVVIVPDGKTAENQKGVIYARDPDLQTIIKAVYPQFGFFSLEGRERALLFIAKMNPAVHSKIITPAVKKGVLPLVFTAEKGEPVLIPEFKFISE